MSEETNLCPMITKAISKDMKPEGAGVVIKRGTHLKFIQESLQNDSRFYKYIGSQTMPPCHYQNWLISPVVFKVKEDQVKQFL